MRTKVRGRPIAFDHKNIKSVLLLYSCAICKVVLYISRCLRLRRNAHRPKSRFQQPYFPVLAWGILGKNRLVVTPPLEDCLTRLKGSSTLAGTGCTDLQLICGRVASQPYGHDWSLLAGNKEPVCPRHEGGRGRMTEADTSRIVLPGLVSHQHRHKPGLLVADCQALT